VEAMAKAVGWTEHAPTEAAGDYIAWTVPTPTSKS